MHLWLRPSAVKGDLFRLLDEMPETLLVEVQTFAEFLQHREEQIIIAHQLHRPDGVKE